MNHQNLDAEIEEILPMMLTTFQGAYRFLVDSAQIDEQLQQFFLSKSTRREWYITPKDAHFRNFSLLNATLFIESDFQCAFRMSRASAERLHTLLQPHITKKKTRFRQPVPSMHRLLIFLYHVSKPASYSIISNLFAYGTSTISEIVREVALAIVENLRDQYIRWPTQYEMNVTAEAFRRKHGIPQCVGCVDGSHFPIRRPKKYGDTYFNRKGFYSFNGQGKIKILWILLA